MEIQLRFYDVKAGELDAFLDEWRRGVVPLREAHGFRVLGAWPIEATSQFVWVLAHEGPESFAEADERYYASPERAALDPDPARHLAETRAWMVASAL